MSNEMKETELNEVAGGVSLGDDWDYVVTCSCGYCEHFKTLAEATKALLEHIKDGKEHSCSINVSKKSK